jgi:hypothetical protein
MRSVSSQKYTADTKVRQAALMHEEVTAPGDALNALSQLRMGTKGGPVHLKHMVRISRSGSCIRTLAVAQQGKEHDRAIQRKDECWAIGSEEDMRIRQDVGMFKGEFAPDPSLGVVLADHVHAADPAHGTSRAIGADQVSTAKRRRACLIFDGRDHTLGTLSQLGKASGSVHVYPSGEQLFCEHPLSVPLLQILLRGVL